MTIQITVGTGKETRSFIYRKVYKGKNYADQVESFHRLRETYQWGVMVQLRGKQIIKLYEFGRQ